VVGHLKLGIHNISMGLYANFIIVETGLCPPVAVNDIPQSGVTDNESKVQAFDPVVFFGDKITSLGPSRVLMKRFELRSRVFQLTSHIMQRPFIGFDLKAGLLRCRGRRRIHISRFGC